MSDDAHAEVASKRPVLAAVLAAIVPGLGHVYIRMWGRAVMWFLLYVLATQVFVPSAAMPSTASLEAIREAITAVPRDAALLLVTIALLNVFDAFLMTRYHNQEVEFEASGRRRCPECGREVDADLDFCHWCTTELEAASESTE